MRGELVKKRGCAPLRHPVCNIGVVAWGGIIYGISRGFYEGGPPTLTCPPLLLSYGRQELRWASRVGIDNIEKEFT
jgi:hypothetical protein